MNPMHKSAITCITCPIGCRITVEAGEGEYLKLLDRTGEASMYSFSGNRCPRGQQFALAEMTAPMRSVTSTVRTVFPDLPVVPVRTRGEVPKGIIPEIIRELAKVKISERIGIGEVVIADILGTGCDIIVTGNMLEGENYGKSACIDN